ncbi:MAG: hypothetical protein O2895_04330 [Chloroflexi bacterium]|nr:hypothetical protein [Chloroflexota bacterium]
MRATSLNYRDLMLARSTREAIIPLSDGAGEVDLPPVFIPPGELVFRP